MKPIDKAADAVLANFHGPNKAHPSWHLNPETVARAVFASIDTDEIAEVVRIAQNVPFVGPKQRRIAEAVKAHLLKEDA